MAKRKSRQTIRKDFMGNEEMIQISGDDDSEDHPDGHGAGNDKWYKKPIGIVVLSVVSGTLVLIIGLLIRHFIAT